MIAFDIAYELTLGAACALCGRPARPSRFVRGLIVSALIYVPTCVVAFVAWPGWQAMYLVDLDRGGPRAGVAVGLAVSSLFAAYLCGYVAAAAGRRSGRAGAVKLAIGGLWLALVTLLVGVLGPRAVTVTSHDDFHAGATRRIGPPPAGVLSHPLPRFLAISAALNAAGLVYALGLGRSERLRPPS